MSDTLSSGRRFRCLTILDEFNRESLAIHVARSSKRPSHMWSRTGSRQPIGARTCSSAAAGSWVTGLPI